MNDLDQMVLFLISPLMRLTILSLLCLLLFGCSKDEFVPCNGVGIPGNLCREYRFYNDVGQGYVEFSYAGDSVVSSIYNQQSVLEKTIIERYANGRLISITNQFPADESVVATFHYNEMDSLFLVVYGANDSTIQISYQNGKRYLESRIAGDVLLGFKEYRYFQNGGELYRISDFDADSLLLGYRNFDYFNTNEIVRYRATEYTPNHQLIGRRLFTFSQLGLISSMEYKLADGIIAESKNYIYDSAGKLAEEQGYFAGNTTKSVYLYH